MPGNAPLQVVIANVPRFLREFLLWCVWRFKAGIGKGTYPVSPMTGGVIGISRPFEWSRFEDAATTYQRGGHAGLGVLIREEHRVIGINIDRCIDENGTLLPWADAIVRGLPTYWEVSPSRRGLRGFVRGTLPPECPRKVAVAEGRVEVYCDGHFLTVTGHRLPGSSEDLQDCPAQLNWFISLLQTPQPNAALSANFSVIDRPAPSCTELEDWPEPETLEGVLVPVAPFDPALLPDAFRVYGDDVAERLQVPLDFIGAALLVTFGSVVGRRARIAPKRFDDWEECGNLWGGVVAEPGSMKSPAIKRVLKILHSLEQDASRQHAEALQAYEREREAWGERELAWKRDAPARADHGDDPGVFPEPEPQEPTCIRFIINDATLPMLQKIMAENAAGVLRFRDELAGFFAMLDAQGRQSERPFYLESWSGDQPFVLDRIARGTTRAERICLSLFGGIQPSVLRRYLLGAITSGDGNDGLPQRLQILVYPNVLGDWVNIDREPNLQAEENVTNIFRFVTTVPPEVYVARFDTDAQEFFNEWRAKLERRLRREHMPHYLQAHLAKYRGLFSRIALLCHLADSGFAAEVSLRQAQRAAAWCGYLETHARRVYAEASPRSAAAMLGEKLKAGSLGQRFTLREIRKKGWAGFDDPTVIRAAFRELEDAGWVRREPNRPSERGGRPAEAYLLNPRVLEQ